MRVISWWMLSRSSGVMKVLCSSWTVSWVIRSAFFSSRSIVSMPCWRASRFE